MFIFLALLIGMNQTISGAFALPKSHSRCVCLRQHIGSYIMRPIGLNDLSMRLPFLVSIFENEGKKKTPGARAQCRNANGIGMQNQIDVGQHRRKQSVSISVWHFCVRETGDRKRNEIQACNHPKIERRSLTEILDLGSHRKLSGFEIERIVDGLSADICTQLRPSG